MFSVEVIMLYSIELNVQINVCPSEQIVECVHYLCLGALEKFKAEGPSIFH